MKTGKFAKVGFYVGAIIGIVLFLAVWMLPVSYFAGAWGSKIFGSTHGVLVGISMVIGVLTAGVFFSLGAALTGWCAGLSFDTLKAWIVEKVAQSAKNRHDESSLALSDSREG